MHYLGRFLCLLAIFQYHQLSLIIVLASESCIQICGDGLSPRLVPFPFGFSSSCLIQINCSSHGVALIGEFPVRRLTPNYILMDIQANCNRPIQSIQHLFRRNFAPTSRNGILLQNCKLQGSPCPLPETIAATHMDMLDCVSTSGNTSCYVEDKGKKFIDYSNLTRIGCRNLYSSISVEPYNMSAIAMEVEVVELEWWLEGNCSCSNHSSCTKIVSPMNLVSGYRCECVDGFVGDGYASGIGCRRAPAALNPEVLVAASKFPESARNVALTGGITAVASITMTVAIILCYIRRQSRNNTFCKTEKRLTKEACHCNIPMFSYKDIERATCGFSSQQKLGTGAFGTVYAGRFPNRECVAVKRIKYKGIETTEQVINEVKLLSSVSHPNLLRLLGCSVGKGEQILVYEFMPNGTLSQHLQGERGEGLPWEVRLGIAVDTAGAIAYLHSAKPPIYHRDIKSTNILLDEKFQSKVADFGLSRLGMPEISHFSTTPQGTPGYLDPQYHQSFTLSDRSDVYSFGVVLMEMITGMKPVDLSRQGSEVYLASMAVERIRKGCLEEIVDAELGSGEDEWVRSSVHRVAEVGFRCLSFQQDARPSMKEVAVELEQVQQSWCSAAENGRAGTTGIIELLIPCSSSPTFCNRRIKSCCDSSVEESSSVSADEPWFSQHSSPSTSVLLENVD